MAEKIPDYLGNHWLNLYDGAGLYEDRGYREDGHQNG